MLLTIIEEIEACLPTSKWDDADRLLGIIEEEEENMLVPILGRELFDHLVSEYETLMTEYGDITPSSASLPKDAVTDTIRMIRLCQKVQLYAALANNSGLLAVSFNGAGLNTASADGYDEATKDAIARFERDAWKKAHRNIDALLGMLERDAKSKEPAFAKMWKTSRYFYLKANLLITTAQQMQDYLNINESREKYIELVPDIKNAQDTYLVPELGKELADAFIRQHTDATVIPSYKPEEDEELTEGDLLAKNGEIKGVWYEALDMLRTALAHYTAFVNDKMRKSNTEGYAEMARARALRYISEHQEAFMPYIESSPLYVAPVEPVTEEKEGCKPKPKRYGDGPMFVLPHHLH